MLRRFCLAAQALSVFFALTSAVAQTPSTPPMIVQVPFISVGAGNIVSGASSTSKAASCGGYANASGNNYGDGCPANQAGVLTPWGVVVDRWGNVYFSDEGHKYVRVIYAGPSVTVNGVVNPATAMIAAANTSLGITTPLVTNDVYALAGGLTSAPGSTACNGGGTPLNPGTDGSGCPATDSFINAPYSPAVDSAGNVFIPDKGNSLVYVVLANATGLAAKLVALENPSSFPGCATNFPTSCTGAVPQVGYIYQIVGKGGGYVDGVIANNSGEVHAPYGIAVDSNENLYVADFTNNAVRMVNGPNNTTSGGFGAGFIHTIAGSTCTSSGCAALSGTPASGVAAVGAAFVGPGSVVVDGSGNVYIGDNSNNVAVPTTVRVIYAGGTNNPLANLIRLETGNSSPTAADVYTIAGNKTSGTSGAGAGLLATNSNVNFDRIEGLGLDSHGNLYIMDYGSHSELAEVNADTGILIYLSADGEPSSAAKYTVGTYCSNGTTSGSGPTALDVYGDGCPAPQSNSANAQGNIGVDPSGNLYFADNGDSLVRKLTFNNSFPATTVGSAATTQNLAFLLETGSTGATVSSVSPVIVSTQGITTGSEFINAGTGDSCSGSTTLKGLTSSSSNTASTVCIVPVVFTPAKAGARSGAVQITGTIGSVPTLLGTVYLNGIGNGASLAIDPGTSSTLGSVSGPQGVATDSAGNVYIAYNNGTVYRTPTGGGTPVEIGSGLTTPHQVAIDGAGNLYVADSGANEIVEFAGASTSSSATTGTAILSGLTSPMGVAVDASGNLYIAETGSVLFQSIDNGMQTQLGSGFTTPVAVAVDSNGNVYVADTGLNAIEELSIADGAVTQQTTETLLSGTAPMSVAVDAAGDLYYGDSRNGEVVEIPLSGTTAAIAGGFTTPVGVALDPNGNLYVADSASGAGISYFNRTAATLPAIPDERTDYATITNIGVTSYSGGISSNSDSNVATDFTFSAGSSNGCNTPVSFTLAAGNNCQLGVTANTSTATDTVTFTGGSILALSSGASMTVGTTTTVNIPVTSITYGASISGSVTVTPASGGLNPTGTVALLSGSTTLGSCTLANATGNTSSCNFSLSNVNAGNPTVTASYGGDSNNGTSHSSGVIVNISQASTTTTLSLTSSATITEGSAFTGTASVTPATTSGIVSLYLDGRSAVTTCTLSGGTCSWSLSGVAIGGHSLTATYGGNTDYAVSSTASATSIAVNAPPQAPAVATGDSRTVTEPSFPAVCTALTAALTSVNDDIPASVDATVTNPDGARIQAALNSCAASNPGQAVELSVDGAGHNAYLTGPLTMPSNVTLLVDPGVVVYFSRNVQDYDKVAGTHTCGTVNSSSATSSCQPLIDIKNATNVGIMGFGKLDGRGGDTLINTFPSSFAGQSWWGLSSIANSGGSQQNPRFIQIDSGSSNITLYKITIRNSPLFHVSTTGAASNFTAWDIKIVTPTSSRNTDGIDPGNAQNFTITRSWISDGDDNIAVGAANTTPATNISVTNNHFFAGHGESIGSYTQGGVSNVLFDGNMSSGNGTAGAGSSVANTADSNSTGIRIKSGYDRGGVVSNVQYSNSCFQFHKAEIVFNPNYENTTGSASPNFKNILLQNLTFLTEGTMQFTGTNNNGAVFPLQVTLDNVNFATLQTSDFGTAAAGTAPTNASLTYGPGQVSNNFIMSYGNFVGSSGNTVTNQITGSSLFPPACNFTYIAPELTGPAGLPQTITEGQNVTAVVILTPAVGGSAYPTGTVTLTDALTSSSTTVTLTGTGDTISIPLTGLTVGTHSFTASYSGDANYVPSVPGSPYTTTGSYLITVNPGSLGTSTTALSGVPVSTPFGSSFTAVATVAGSNPTGTVQFIVNGSTYATAALSSGAASANISLPFSATAYSIFAVYSGDAANAGSTSSTSSLTISPAGTATVLSASTTTTTLGHPVILTAIVSSSAGTPTGTVSFSYTNSSNSTPVSIGPAVALNNSSASASAELPQGTNAITATYAGSGDFAGSASAPMIVTINFPTIIGLPSSPIALPYTITTVAGGATASNANTACAGSTDSLGDGCQGSAIAISAGDDLRGVAADAFGNVFFSDKVAKLVRRIAPNGVISNFAGKVSGTTCVPTATVGCTPTLVAITAIRGVSSDGQGNIYMADFGGNKVYKVSVSTGLMYLVAGTGTAGATTNGSPATSTPVDAPRGVWADTVGNIYIADTSANEILVVDPTGAIHIFAGNGTAGFNNSDGVLATSAEINNPQGVLTDANLNVYIADSSNGRIRVVCVTCGTNSPLDALLATLGISSPANNHIYTIAGSGSNGTYSGALPTLATNVPMTPEKLAFDTGGNIYIADSNNVIWFFDFHTGNIRAIARNSGICASATDSVGDGCPATQASLGSGGGNGIGVAADSLGNVYISDTTNLLIRKVNTGLASASTSTGSTTTQPVQLHFTAGEAPAASNSLAFTSTEWTLGTPACTINVDGTTDCLLNSSFTPAVPGMRSTPLAVNSSLGNTANLALTGVGLGAGSTLDPASQVSFGTNLQVAGLATDTAGNVYVSDAISKQLLRFAPAALSQGTSATSTPLATLTAPGAVAVDPRGYVYVADTSTGLITQISPSGTASTLGLTLTSPAGLAVDSLNNLYVSDSATQTVYQLNPINGASRTLAVGTLVAPAGLAIDPSGNLLITDPGAAAIYRFNLQRGQTTTVSSAAVRPSAIATDAAGNLLIADTASILAVPASSNSASFTVASLVPSALAIDSAGDLYTGSGGSILELTRTQGYAQFAGASGSPQIVNLLESGNQALQLSSVSQSDTADYSLAASASADCTLNGTLPSILSVGGVCALTATFTPTTFVTTTDTATFNGNLANAALSTPPSVQLVLTGPSVPPTATIALNPITPASPMYGQTVTVSATVSGPGLTPAGTVVFTVDSSTTTATVTGGVATATLTGLNAGAHTVSAAYTSSNGFAPASTSAATNFTVSQAMATVTLSNLMQTYIGSPLSATAATTPAGLGVSFNYSGSATAPTAAGSYAVLATINNPNYSGSASGTLTIAKAATTISFSSNPTNPILGQSDLLSATVTGIGQPGGVVVFSSSATTLCTAPLNAPGMASCSFVPSTDGNLTVTAQYQGDTNHLSSSTSMMLFVYDAAVKLQLSSTQLTYPGAANVTVCISPATSATATGTVQIFDGTTLLTTLNIQGGGCAYWYISPGLSAGTHQLTAVYSGDRNNPSGTSIPVTVTVSSVPVKLSASCWNASFAYGANYQCTVNVSSNAGAPSGSISYSYDGGSAVTVPLSNGNAQFTLSRPNAGTHTVIVAYSQQTNYAAATSQAETFTVTPAPVNVSLTPSSWYAKAGTSLTFQAAVSSWSAGAPNETGTVSFYDGTTLLSAVPVNANGQASFTTASLPAGTQTINVTYAGGTNYASGSVGVTITLTQ